jgi:hypothetical protein
VDTHSEHYKATKTPHPKKLYTNPTSQHNQTQPTQHTSYVTYGHSHAQHNQTNPKNQTKNKNQKVVATPELYNHTKQKTNNSKKQKKKKREGLIFAV